jgi:hypothetical protein
MVSHVFEDLQKRKTPNNLEGGSGGGSKSGSKASTNDNGRTKKWLEAKWGVLTVESWVIGKQATSAY